MYKTTSKVIALATTFGHWKYFLNGFIIESFIRFFSQNFLGKIRQNENWKNEDLCKMWTDIIPHNKTYKSTLLSKSFVQLNLILPSSSHRPNLPGILQSQKRTFIVNSKITKSPMGRGKKQYITVQDNGCLGTNTKGKAIGQTEIKINADASKMSQSLA